MLPIFLSVSADAGIRTKRPFGLDVGLFTEPCPSIYGFSGSFNLSDHLRITAGYAPWDLSDGTNNASASVYSLDGKYFLFTSNTALFISAGGFEIIGKVSGGHVTGGTSTSGFTGLGAEVGAGLIGKATEALI